MTQVHRFGMCQIRTNRPYRPVLLFRKTCGINDLAHVSGLAPALRWAPLKWEGPDVRRRTVLVAASGRGGGRADTETRMRSIMKGSSRVPQDEEPMGIVISQGSRADRPSVFWAYVWAPAPEPASEPAENKAA